jgi:hypothetical protein
MLSLKGATAQKISPLKFASIRVHPQFLFFHVPSLELKRSADNFLWLKT